MILEEIAFRTLLNKGEKIDHVAHVHIFNIYAELFKVLLLGIATPIGAYYMFPAYPFNLLCAAWVLLGALLFIYRLMQWYLDAWIITNHGVIDQEWNSFFDKSTTRIEHGNIEGITTEVKGFWGTILGYGTLTVEHMSGQPVTLKGVNGPRKVERIIMRNQQNFMRRQNFEEKDKLKDLLTSLIHGEVKS